MQWPHYEQVRPPLSLSDQIECFWRLLLPRVVAPGEAITAEGRAEILFQFEGQSQVIRQNGAPFECASSWLMRPLAQALQVRQVGVSSSAMIGVRFSPGGWSAFRHDDTTDQQPYAQMPLRDFYPPGEVQLLEDQLYHKLRTPEWANPLITFFMRRKVEHSHYDRVTYAAHLLRQGHLHIAILPYEVNLSERQFGRVFRQLIGLSPKQFARIARLERVLQATEYAVQGQTLEHLAKRYGYHDPAHLVHEFQELAGMSPGDYFSGYYDLIEQKFLEHDRFLQWEPDRMGQLFTS
jgi:AraC-like DNA-binding protein